MRRTQYKTVEVIGVAGESRGYDYLQQLLSEGWQIAHEDYQEEGVDAEGYERSITRYDLRRKPRFPVIPRLTDTPSLAAA